MKTCHQCGATNPNAANFCLECGKSLSIQPLNPQAKIAAPTLSAAVTSQTSLDPSVFQPMLTRKHQQRKADIMFVLDCTGSMGGEINAIRDAITDFADTIELQSIRVRVGLIEFRDRLNREEHRVLLFDGQPFTTDPKLFRQEVAKLMAYGGGDEPESSLDAIGLALDQPFDRDSDKVIVMVTDAPPHLPDLETKNIEQLVQKMNQVGISQFYAVVKTQDPRSHIYLKLLGAGTRNLAFDIGTGDNFRERAEHFKRTLMALGKTISAATR